MNAPGDRPRRKERSHEIDLRPRSNRVLTGVLVAAIAGGARADATFTDPVGDQSKPTAPDITGVQVANTPDGTLAVRVTVANYQSVLPPLSGVVIGFDTDKNPATGDQGVDAALGYLVDRSRTPARRSSPAGTRTTRSSRTWTPSPRPWPGASPTAW